MRAALERVGVEIVEVGDVAEAADERLMTDVYSRPHWTRRTPSALATVVVTCDARLRVCVEQARVRGVYTVVVSDFLRTWRSRPEFKHLLARFSDGSPVPVDDDDDDDDRRTRARCASSARWKTLQKFKTRAFSRRGLAVGSTESARDDERRAAFPEPAIARATPTISVDPPPRPAASSANSPIETSRLGPPRASPPRITSVRSAHSGHRLYITV